MSSRKSKRQKTISLVDSVREVNASMRLTLDEQIQELKLNILKMGSLMEESIYKAVKSLAHQDLDLAREVISSDQEIDSLENAIEARCLSLLALQNPLASDLRKITTILKIVTDLERMADEAVNIAEVTIMNGNEPLIKPLEDIPAMAEAAAKMVKGCLDAFVNQDQDLAIEVVKADDQVDEKYSALFDELVEMIIEQAPFSGTTQAIRLLFVARYLERIADHATNIAERTIYMITGDRVTHRKGWWKE